MKNISDFLPLGDDALEDAYDELYKNLLTKEEISNRPPHLKVSRVKSILRNEVTPGCYAQDWYNFFQVLEIAQKQKR